MSKKKQEKKRNHKKLIFLDTIKYMMYFLFIIGLFAGYGFIKKSAGITEYVEPNIYEFEISGKLSDGTGFTLSHFLWDYDFSKNSGTLSFIVREGKKDKIENLEFLFPMGINNKSTTVEIFNCGNPQKCIKKSDLEYSADFLAISSNRTTLRLSQFSRELNKDENIKIAIKFKMNIQPSGIFAFRHYENKIISDRYTLNLKFGDNYACSFNCFEPIKAIDLYWNSTLDRNILLKFNDAEQSHIFKLQSINSDNIFKKDRDLALGVSLLVSFITLLIQQIIKDIEECIKNKSP